MNRRSFITAIPAAVAALTASKPLAGAMSPVAASEAIVGQSESVFPLRAGEKLRVVVSDDHSVFNVYRMPPHTYVAPRGVASEIENLTHAIDALIDVLEGE